MSALTFNNSSISLSTDNIFKGQLKQYMRDVNYFLFYIQLGICIFGLVGNLLVVLVINQKSLRNTSSAVFITYLAIFDSAVLIFHGAHLAKPKKNLYLHCTLTFFTDLSIFCANWILVIITVERCVAVYSPFLAKRFCTTHSARRSIFLFLTISAIFFAINFPLLYQIKGVSTSEKCRIRPEASRFIRIYQPILFIGIPDCFLLSNLFTIYALFRRRQRISLSYMNKEEKLEMRVNDVHCNRKQRQLTIMLVTVSLSFYLFTTPAMIVFIKEMQRRQHQQLDKYKRDFLFSQITVVFSELNNATNFIFYCFTGQRFRHAAQRYFHQYSRRWKLFYHRYILCNRQYRLPMNADYNTSFLGNTVITTRSSYSPNYQRQNFRAST